jgi:hypothetical protein
MNAIDQSRRELLKAAGLCAVSAACGIGSAGANAQEAIPFSSGTEPPKTSAPPNACDSHIHIFSTRFPASSHWKGEPVVDSDVAAYRRLQKRLGTSRVVVVTPSTYGTDNRATLDGVAQLGNSARAVVVVDLDISDASRWRLKAQSAFASISARRNRGVRRLPNAWRLWPGRFTRSAGMSRFTRRAIRSLSLPTFWRACQQRW